jgi:hypothetical protein
LPGNRSLGSNARTFGGALGSKRSSSRWQFPGGGKGRLIIAVVVLALIGLVVGLSSKGRHHSAPVAVSTPVKPKAAKPKAPAAKVNTTTLPASTPTQKPVVKTKKKTKKPRVVRHHRATPKRHRARHAVRAKTPVVHVSAPPPPQPTPEPTPAPDPAPATPRAEPKPVVKVKKTRDRLPSLPPNQPPPAQTTP